MSHDPRLVEACAYLRSLTPARSLADIADLLNCARSTVHELEKEATAAGLLITRHEFDPHGRVSPARRAELKRLQIYEKLRDRLRTCSPPAEDGSKRLFRELYILPAKEGVERKEMDQRLGAFAEEAALVVYKILKASSCAGVTWGTTLGTVIRRMASISPSQDHPRVSVIPTCGEPLGSGLQINSSTYLAAELTKALRGNERDIVSLSGVPVVIPREFHRDPVELAAIQKFIHSAPGYRKVFGFDPNRLDGDASLHQLDTILTSASRLTKPFAMSGTELWRIAGIEPTEFQQFVLGDVGGALLPRLTPEQMKSPKFKHELEEFDRIRKTWMGLQWEHLHKVARRQPAAKTGKPADYPGVVVLAIDRDKTDVVLRAVKLGLLNTLICDSDLALGIHAVLAK
ncbi:MAG: hypothetical protein HY301_13750 [Verrucomicrobia bacterium]|nr:hypothetical protein [Verrucomicrobiota bacterium]